MRCTALTTGQGKEGLDTHVPKHSKKKWGSKEPKDDKNGITCFVPQLTRERIPDTVQGHGETGMDEIPQCDAVRDAE